MSNEGNINTAQTELIENLIKQHEKLGKRILVLDKKFNKETNYGDNDTDKGDKLTEEIFSLGEMKGVLINSIKQLKRISF